MNLLSEFEWYPLHEKAVEKMRDKLKKGEVNIEDIDVVYNKSKPGKRQYTSIVNLTPNKHYKEDFRTHLTKDRISSERENLYKQTKDMLKSEELAEGLKTRKNFIKNKPSLLKSLKNNKKLLLGLGLLGTGLTGTALVKGHQRTTKDGKIINVNPFKRKK